ncbi:hypothetical protein J6X96_04620 [bacterium]|nr:hypothetical protein [bacterium]
MKNGVLKLALFLSLFSFMSAQAYERELMRIGFESGEGYELGSVLGQNGWTAKDPRHNYETSKNDVTESLGPDGSRAMHLEGANNFVGLNFDMSEMEFDKDTEYLVWSFKLQPFEDTEGRGGIDSYFKLGVDDGASHSYGPPSVFETKNWNGESFRVYGYDLIENQNKWLILPYEFPYEYNDIAVTMDMAKYHIISWQVGSLVTNVSMAFTSQKKQVPNWMSFEMYGNIDDIVLKAVSKPAPPGAKLETYTKKIELSREPEDFYFTVRNTGTNKVNYVVSFEGDPGWVEAVNGEGSIDGEGEKELQFKLLRDDMGDFYYRSVIRVDGGMGGVLEVPLSVQSGLVFYQEDFSGPYMTIGEISGQDRWYTDRSGTIDGSIGNGMAYNSFVVTNMPFAIDGELARIICSGGYYGYEYTIDTPSNLIVTVEFDFYWPSDSQAANFDVTGELWKHIPFTLNFRKAEGDTLFKATKAQGVDLAGGLGSNQYDCDAWHHLKYAMDFRQQVVPYIEMDGDRYEFGDEMPLQTYNGKVFRTLHTLNFGSDGVQKNPDQIDYVSGVCIDNLLICEEEREAKPNMTGPSYVSMRTDDSCDIVLKNSGAESCQFEAEVLDDAPLVVSPYTGILSESFTVNVAIKEEPEPGFYRYFVRFFSETGGCLTTMVSCARGGIYYTTDFEEPYFHPGNINGQDGWTLDPEQNVSNLWAFVEEIDGQYALRYYDCGGYSGTLIPAFIPAWKKFTFSCKLYVAEEGPHEAILYVKQFGHNPLQEFWVWRDKENDCAWLYVKGYEDLELPPAPLNEWFDFSYTLDMGYDKWQTTDITFGDCVTNVADLDIYFENERDGDPVTALSICSSGDLEEALYANIYVDDIFVHDAAVPEPAVLAMLAALVALVLRKW